MTGDILERNLIIYTDGGARGNPGPGAIGVYVTEEDGKVLAKISKRIGQSTNNEAEYRAVIEALKWIIESAGGKVPALPRGEQSVKFFLDSKLVVNQLNGIFKIKENRLRNLLIEVRGLEQEIGGKIIYNHVPRGKNKMADYLVNASFSAL